MRACSGEEEEEEEERKNNLIEKMYDGTDREVYMYEKRKRNEKHLEEMNPFPTPCLAVTKGKYIQHY